MAFSIHRIGRREAALPSLRFASPRQAATSPAHSAGSARVASDALRLNFRITRRGVQVALGLIWFLDGVLQFQSYFFTNAFLTQMIAPMASGQPRPVASSITWAAHLAAHHVIQYDLVFGLVQVAIGLGLLFPPTVRAGLILSFIWVPIVWWFGEGFGQITAGTASPLTGAPGAVLVYGIIGLLAWPARPDGESVADGSPIGARGGRLLWSLLWLLDAALWLLAVNRSSGAFSGAVASAEPNSMGWLASLQGSVARATSGHGLALAIALAVVSVVIATGVWTPFVRAALWFGIVLSLGYWLVGQGMGEINTTQATDPNAGPLFILLALALMPRRRTSGEPARRRASASGASAEPSRAPGA